MDEHEYRELYHSINSNRCVFEKALLTRRFGCSQVARINIGDREAAGCSNPAAMDVCAELLDQMHGKATFALGMKHVNGPLPHAREMKVQCGGLLGLEAIIYETDAPEGTADIFGLIAKSIREYEEINQLPYSLLMQHIAHYEGRPRRKRD